MRCVASERRFRRLTRATNPDTSTRSTVTPPDHTELRAQTSGVIGMRDQLPSKMPELHVGQGYGYGGLTVFPVWVDAPIATGFDLGDAATIDIAEREGSPVVGELVAHNRGHRPALLLEGELIEGGWQNRVLVFPLLLAADASEVVEVACVEEGRWHGGVAHARRSRAASPSVRAALRGDPNERQRDVWDKVGAFDQALGASATSSLTDHLDSVRPDPKHEIHQLAGQRGVVVGIGGVPAYLEIYPSPEALAAHWDGLIAAAALDAQLAPKVRTPAQAARSFAESVQRSRLAADRPAGLGTVIRSTGKAVNLRGIARDGQLLHASAVHTHHAMMRVA